jgi:catechol 2,3-dioxygenase-like lactoylglutathione lyase family enzyme
MYGVWHFSFTVSDMERSVAFYRDVLSFELIHRQEQANEYTRRLVGYADAHLRIAQFAVPGQPRSRSTHDLELVEYIAPRGTRGDIGICNPGASHLAIAVDDIDERYGRLIAAGVHFFSPPNRITAGVNEGGFTCYFHDPDQIVLEMVQPPAVSRRPAEGNSRTEVLPSSPTQVGGGSCR